MKVKGRFKEGEGSEVKLRRRVGVEKCGIKAGRGGGGWVRMRGSRDGWDREVREYGWRSGVGI